MAQDRQKQRNQLIRQALLAAVREVDQAAKPDDVFVPIGELVFWIVATDEGLRKQYGQSYISWRNNHQHGHLFPAIRYARNKVAHETEAWDYEDKDILTERLWSRLGAWMWVRLPAPGPKDPQHWHVQFAAYETYLRDKAVLDTTMNAVDLLEDWWKQHGI